MIALGFVGLAARAAYVQVVATTFSSARARCALRARWSCPPTGGAFWIATADPGLQRAAPSIWAIPEDVDDKPEVLAKLKQLAKAAGHAAGRT
jgi:cell division protein FtsI (penicillin-binding protein 3)